MRFPFTATDFLFQSSIFSAFDGQLSCWQIMKFDHLDATINAFKVILSLWFSEPCSDLPVMFLHRRPALSLGWIVDGYRTSTFTARWWPLRRAKKSFCPGWSRLLSTPTTNMDLYTPASYLCNFHSFGSYSYASCCTNLSSARE
eukprot:m.597849 g.597849  ORF g.597849 m.597849 type:complete len:144 (+) comp58072_c0_seq7:1037-1468(+)